MADRVMAAVTIAIALVLLVEASGYVSGFSYEPIGPRAFPIGILVLIVLVSLRIALTARPGTAAAPGDTAPADYAFPPGATALRRAGTLRASVAVALILLVYALIFEPVGYLIATFLAAALLALVAKARPLPAVLVGVVVSGGGYVLFAEVLYVNLPLGHWLFG